VKNLEIEFIKASSDSDGDIGPNADNGGYAVQPWDIWFNERFKSAKKITSRIAQINTIILGPLLPNLFLNSLAI
jgi:hypothetical protein